MIGDTTETWTFTVEQNVRVGVFGLLEWHRTAGVEVDEHTARRFYEQALRGLPDHLRAPRLTRITREIVAEPDAFT